MKLSKKGALAKHADELSEVAEEIPALTDHELREAFIGPAVRANKIYLSPMDDGATVRLAFMEQHGDAVPPIFRSAVILSQSDAIALRNLLTSRVDWSEG